jgi:hypothetical protein
MLIYARNIPCLEYKVILEIYTPAMTVESKLITNTPRLQDTTSLSIASACISHVRYKYILLVVIYTI